MKAQKMQKLNVRQNKANQHASTVDKINIDCSESNSLATASFNFSGQPKGLGQGCQLQPHQIDSLKWMLSLYQNGVNGILADDMVSSRSSTFNHGIRMFLVSDQFHFFNRVWVRPSRPLHSWRICTRTCS